MANPNAIVGNGGDLTVGNTVFLPNIGPVGRLLALGVDFQIITSDLAGDNISVEATPDSILKRTSDGGIKGKIAILGPIQFPVGAPSTFTLFGAGADAVNTTFFKTSDTTYIGSNGSSITLISHSWYLADPAAATQYVSPEALFPAQWATAGGPDPAPSLLASDINTVLQIVLSGSPQKTGIRVVAANSQAGNLQEWCDDNGVPFTWIDGNARLVGKTVPVSGVWFLTDGVNYGTVAGLGLPFTPQGVIATVNGADGSGPPLSVTVARSSMTSDGFDYTISAVQQDGSILAYTCVP